jgi:hypothetical protein
LVTVSTPDRQYFVDHIQEGIRDIGVKLAASTLPDNLQ